MKIVKTIALWVLAVFFILFALVFMPSVSSIFALLMVVLVIPISKWQDILTKFIRGKLKIVIAIALALLTVFTAPTTDNDKIDGSASTVTMGDVTDSTTDSTTDPVTDPVADSTTVPTTDPTTPQHTHNFGDATCTTPKTCATCGTTEGGLADHSWTAATCTDPQKCKTCSAIKGTAIGHNYYRGTCLRCGAKDPEYVQITYVLNTQSKKFHKLSCSRLPTDNRKDTTMSRQEVIAAGYDPCGICNP